MKKNQNHQNPHHQHQLQDDGRQPVHLEFQHPSATTVRIAGTFNDWRPDATPMIEIAKGRWLKDLVLPPGNYEYLLVADDCWLPDPRAQTVPNPFGGVNSVLRVPKPPRSRNGS